MIKRAHQTKKLKNQTVGKHLFFYMFTQSAPTGKHLHHSKLLLGVWVRARQPRNPNV
jgi:hypothetical protein